MGVSCLGIRKHPLNIGFRHRHLPCRVNGLTEGLIFPGIGLHLGGAVGLGDVAGFQDGIEMPGADLGARHHGGHFLFFNHLPVDKRLDIGMIQVQANHFGGPAGGAARFNGPCRPIADAKEGHETR